MPQAFNLLEQGEAHMILGACLFGCSAGSTARRSARRAEGRHLPGPSGIAW
jgi:hypothetical protein